jgi:hypothetical protein
MKFLNINKLVGVALGIVCGAILLYGVWFPLTGWMNHIPRWSWPTFMYMAGTAFTMFAVIPHNRHGQLIFFGKPLEAYWTPGPCILPNLFHFTTENVNFSLLYGLELFPEDEPMEKLQNKIEHRVFIDQRLPVHQRQVQVGWLASKLELVGTSLFVWLLDYKNGKPIYIFQRLGLRVMLVAYACAVGMNFFNWTQGIVPIQ